MRWGGASVDDAWRLALVIGVYAVDMLIVVLVVYIATVIADWVRMHL